MQNVVTEIRETTASFEAVEVTKFQARIAANVITKVGRYADLLEAGNGPFPLLIQVKTYGGKSRAVPRSVTNLS